MKYLKLIRKNYLIHEDLKKDLISGTIVAFAPVIFIILIDPNDVPSFKIKTQLNHRYPFTELFSQSLLNKYNIQMMMNCTISIKFLYL